MRYCQRVIIIEVLGVVMGVEIVYLILGLGAAFYMAWNLGANDAANPTDTAVGAGAIKLKHAILLFAIFAAIGAITQGYMVMKTIGKGLVEPLDPLGALVASVAAGLWVTIATWKGMPVSTTHSTIGAVLGVGLAYMMFHEAVKLKWHILLAVILSWITSPLSAIMLSLIFYTLFKHLAYVLLNKGVNIDKFFRALLIYNLAFSAYSFGVNDVGNATGVYVTVVSKIFGTPDMTTMLYLSLLGSLGIALGAFTWGYRVISTVGFKITRLDYLTASSAELSNALVVWCFSTIPKFLIGYGMPISTTHASVSSVIGVGIAKSRSLKGVDWKVVGYIVISWILTVPIAASISFIIYIILSHLLF